MTPPPSPPSDAPSAASALSGHFDTRTAATEIAHLLYDAIGDGPDLVIVFASYHHLAAFPEALNTIRQTLMPKHVLAVSAEGILGDDDELEGLAGMSAVAMRLPGVTMTPWSSTPSDPIPLKDQAAAAARIGAGLDFRTAIMLADPFSTPITRLLPALTECGGDRPVPIVGGLASGSSQPGHNQLGLDDTIQTEGAVGVSLSGDIAVDYVVSQGCRPVGTPLVVTRCDKNVLIELGGRPALGVLQEVAGGLSDVDKEMVQKGMLLGTVIDETRRPFGRGDFLVRSLLGFDQQKKAIATGEMLRLGQTVQFHLRDAKTAGEDLEMLLDAQQLKAPPFAALLFTCNGRGQRLFGVENHDLSIIRERLGPIPIAGFFAAGEIGPVGDRSFLHGHTAALVLFRRRLGTSLDT